MTSLIKIIFFEKTYNLNIISTNEIIVEISNFIIHSNTSKNEYPFIVDHITQLSVFDSNGIRIKYNDTYDIYDTYNEKTYSNTFNVIATAREETLNYPFIMIDYSKFDIDTCFWIEINRKELICFLKSHNSIYYKLYNFNDKNVYNLNFSPMAKKRIDFIFSKYT